ncbi:uncharacterized protein METZ01_LOCUS340947, partial [marine metagenome]
PIRELVGNLNNKHSKEIKNMRKMLILFMSVLFITSVYAEDYNTVADFSVDNVLNFAGNSNFTISQ